MLLFSTGSLYNYGLDRVFALAAEAGFDGIEVLIDTKWDTRDSGYLRRLSSEYGLPIRAIHSPFIPDIQDWPSDQLGRLNRTVALAGELSVPLVVTHLPMRIHGAMINLSLFGNRRFLLPIPLPRRESYYHFFINGRVQELESSTGIKVAVENMPAFSFLGFRINSSWFNRLKDFSMFTHMTLDTTHLGTWGMDPVEVYSQIKQRVAHVHISNYDGKEHRLPQCGRLPLAEFLRSLAESGYQGAVSVEVTPYALTPENEDICRSTLKQTVDFCRRHMAVSGN